MLEVVAQAILVGIICAGSFVVGWFRGRDALKREQFQATCKHEQEHSR